MDVQLTTSYGVLLSSPRHNPFSQVRCSYIYDGFAVYATVTYCQLKRDCMVNCIGVNATEDARDASPAIFGDEMSYIPKVCQNCYQIVSRTDAYGAISVCGTSKTPIQILTRLYVLLMCTFYH